MPQIRLQLNPEEICNFAIEEDVDLIDLSEPDAHDPLDTVLQREESNENSNRSENQDMITPTATVGVLSGLKDMLSSGSPATPEHDLMP